MAELSEQLAKEFEDLERQFWVSKEKLKEISERFEQELQDGLEVNGRNISMNVTWVQGWPNGKEKGSFLTIDLGGTNVRMCWITLSEGNGDHDIKQHQYKVPDDIKTGTADKLWDFIGGSLEAFIQDEGLKADDKDPLPLGFTFSYPCIQDRLDHGILQTWTKGLDIKGVEGEDVAAQLREAIKKRVRPQHPPSSPHTNPPQNLPVRLIALVNDTVGAMIASSYNDPNTIIGAIFGTGCNAAYMETSISIPKATGFSPNTPMAINCEYGAFDNSRQILPLTKYDKQIDSSSPRPGEQAFEKMSAGLYLGEIYRLVLLDLHSRGLILEDQDVTQKISSPYCIDTGILSAVENDSSPNLSDTAERFKSDFNLTFTLPELELSRRLAKLIAIRGARLCACGIAAICRKTDTKRGHVAADGSVANKHPQFKKRWARALGDILGWEEDREEDPIVITSAEDGSGVGAAVIVALALERGWVT